MEGKYGIHVEEGQSEDMKTHTHTHIHVSVHNQCRTHACTALTTFSLLLLDADYIGLMTRRHDSYQQLSTY